ncbi:MAG TPA: benzoate-CoA ligase family protein [Stellaceae bacterium]
MPTEPAAPHIELPRRYNAAVDLIERNLKAGRADKVAFRDDDGAMTYGQLAERADRAANALRGLGIEPEQRIVLCMLDTNDLPVMFLGAIKAGIVPIPINTNMAPQDYDYILRDSRARVLVVSDALLPKFEHAAKDQPALKHVIPSSRLPRLFGAAQARSEAADTTPDDVAFWLYSSGSTGTPKGVVHLHAHPILTAELYGKPILGIEERDIVYSAAKLFFAYGLGNSLTFPMAVGATTILAADRVTPALVSNILRVHKPTIFYGVPTLFAAMLAANDLPSREEVALRRCASAGEALPEQIGVKWRDRFGIDILDGIGSTEMLHIYLSNRAGDVRYGTTGKPVPGYRVRLVDDDNNPVPKGEIGELQVNGPTSAPYYWNNRERSRHTFMGPWTRSGDKYRQDEDGYYVYCGRTDDMLKVGGIYVSPFEVEGALASHDAVLECAVVGAEDEAKLIKPKAFVVVKQGHKPSPELASALQDHVKSKLAPYKYPRWIEFIDDMPKTATGKIQRFKLRH